MNSKEPQGTYGQLRWKSPYIWNIVLAYLRIEILDLLSRELLVVSEVEVCT